MSEFKFAHRVIKGGDNGEDINLVDTTGFVIHEKDSSGNVTTKRTRLLNITNNTTQSSTNYVAAFNSDLHYSQSFYPLFAGKVRIEVSGSAGYFFLQTINPVGVYDYLKNLYYFDPYYTFGKTIDLRVGFEGSTKATAQGECGIEQYISELQLFGGYTGYSNLIGLSMREYTDSSGRLITGFPDLKALYNKGGKTCVHVWLEEGKGNYFFDNSIDDTRCQDINFTVPITKFDLSSTGSNVGAGGDIELLAYRPSEGVDNCLAQLYEYNNSYISGNLYIKYSDGTVFNKTFDNMILEIGGGMTYTSGMGYWPTEGVTPTASDFQIRIGQRAGGTMVLDIHSNKYSNMSNYYNTISEISGTIYALPSCEVDVTNRIPQQM